MSIFKIFGWLTIGFGSLAIVAILANQERRALGGHSLLPFASVAVLIVLIGVGLLFHRKWAAALFAVLLGGIGLWLATMSVVRVPMPWLILNLGLAFVLIVPGILIVRRWSQLNVK
jgi:hypothetical protein